MGLAALAMLPPGGSGSFRQSGPPASGSLGLSGGSYTSTALALHPPTPSPTEWHLALGSEGGGRGELLYLAAGWHGWEGVATGRELLPALQPGCFQSGCYSMGISPGTVPSPSLTQCRGPGSRRG